MLHSTVFYLLLAFIISVCGRGDAESTICRTNTDASNDNQWIVVPAWLAGTWQARFQTFLDTYDCRLGKRTLEQPATVQLHRSRTIGTQQDASGHIWHFAGTPYVRSAETDSYSERQKITQISVLSSQPSLLKLCTTGEVVRTSKMRNELIDSFYERTVISYSPLSEGVIKVDLTITDFDRDGKALRQSQSVCVERRIKPFFVINRDDRGDLREMFQRFQRDLTSSPDQTNSSLFENSKQ